MRSTEAAADPRLQSRKRTRGGRQRLLQAAGELFRDHGVGATSLQMIADRLGVSKAAIYHHFKSRDEIIDALMEPVFVDVRAGLERISRLPLADRAAEAADFYAAFLVRHRVVVSAVFFERGALSAEANRTVTDLVDAVAIALCRQPPDAARLIAARTRVYGAAAVVAEDQATEDAPLLDLVAFALRDRGQPTS